MLVPKEFYLYIYIYIYICFFNLTILSIIIHLPRPTEIKPRISILNRNVFYNASCIVYKTCLLAYLGE